MRLFPYTVPQPGRWCARNQAALAFCAVAAGVVAFLAAEALGGDDPAAAPQAATSVDSTNVTAYDLAAYGPIETAAEAQATLRKAIAAIIDAGGGVLVVPAHGPANWQFENEGPSSTQPGAVSVTIVDRQLGYERRLLPSNGSLSGLYWSGQRLERNVRQNIDMAFGVHSTKVINTNIAGGTASYIQPSLFKVEAGEGRRIYVPTIRGLHAGMYLNFHTPVRAFGGPVDTGPIKELGWDEEKRLHYFVMDLKLDHPREALISNKHVVNSLSLVENSNSDNQSMALQVTRNLYGQGDAFGIHSTLRNQGNVMSAAGDEGALTFGADIYNDLNPFFSTVESIDWQEQELVYAPGSIFNHTLRTSRPLINENPQKWLTAGTVHIVAPGYPDPWADQPSEAAGSHDFVGGAIIGSKDSGWTLDVLGRFFAVDEPSEYLDPAHDVTAGYTNAPSRRVYRWYFIQKLEDRPDGTKRLFVERTSWWSGNERAPKLYDYENFTLPARERPLKYIISAAPPQEGGRIDWMLLR